MRKQLYHQGESLRGRIKCLDDTMDSSDDGQDDAYYVRELHQILATYLIALFLETLLCGAFAVTYTMGAWILARTLIYGRRSWRCWILLSASTVMFALAVTHLALDLQITLRSFVTDAGSLESVFWTLYDTTLLPGYAIYVTQTLIGDAFMIYRLFLVWNRSRKVIIIPSILFCANVACGYITWAPRFLPINWVLDSIPIAFFSISFITNVLSSALIMWRVVRNISPYTAFPERASLYRKVVEAIVQSAVIYSAASTALVITFSMSPNVAFQGCIGVFPSLIGFVFSFIVLRLAKGCEGGAPRPMQTSAACERRLTARPLSNILLRTPRSPQPAMHLPPFDFSGDAEALGLSFSGRTASIKAAAPLTLPNWPAPESRGLERQAVGGGHRSIPDLPACKLS